MTYSISSDICKGHLGGYPLGPLEDLSTAKYFACLLQKMGGLPEFSFLSKEQNLETRFVGRLRLMAQNQNIQVKYSQAIDKKAKDISYEDPFSNHPTNFWTSFRPCMGLLDVGWTPKNIINPNACSPLAPIQVVKPWAYDFNQGQGADNCTPTLARRTEKGWTLDFIFNRNNLSWASGGIFYYWGVRGTNDISDYADNNLSFGFTSDGRIKWSAYRYSGVCVNGEYSESYYLSSGQTPTLCTTDATKDFNITITFDRYKHYDRCDIENDGGFNDMIGFRTSPYQNIEVTAVTSTQLTVWDPAESLSQKWADERQRRLGTLKIYVNGRPIYKLENWEEVIPSTRGTQPFIQSWGAGTGLMNNIHNGVCCFKMKSIKYYEEPLDFVHVRHDFLNILEHYDFYICGLDCVDDLSSMVTPTPTSTPIPTSTPTPTPTPTSQ
jgi:hypothetical protein